MNCLNCSKCNQNKPTSEFYTREDRKRGFDSQCKSCRRNKKNSLNYAASMSGYKICTSCNIRVPITLFEANKSGKDGRGSHCRKCRHKYRMNRLNTIPELRIVENLRRRTRAVLEGVNKSESTLSLLGCSPEQLKRHLENLFQLGMSWNNYGKWHIDHIIPCDSFDLSNPTQQQKCFHYTNLQPLWAKDNLSKGNTYE